MPTKTFEFAECQEMVTVGNVEVWCYLRDGHAGDHVGHYYWQAAQQSVQPTGLVCACRIDIWSYRDTRSICDFCGKPRR